jgi:hypothetical protein
MLAGQPPPRPPLRTWRTWLLLASIELGLFAIIAAAFWWQDGRYALPTPVPTDYAPPELGADLGAVRARLPVPPDQPVWLHFYQPTCPCSRFNFDEVRRLQHAHACRVALVTVVSEPGTAVLPGAFVVDADGALARACGVYSSPQAVILDAAGRLYYRGNYNRTRYCTDPASAFVSRALTALVAGEALPTLPAAATIAYGCPLSERTP